MVSSSLSVKVEPLAQAAWMMKSTVDIKGRQWIIALEASFNTWLDDWYSIRDRTPNSKR